MTEMRKDRRAPISLKVKYKSATVDEFIEHFGGDVSRGGIFIKTRRPLEVGALLKFEFQLHSGEPVIHGVGRVAWRRGDEQGRPDLPTGMGIKFIKLDDQSRTVIDRIESRHGPGSRFDLNEAAELAPSLSSIPAPGSLVSPPPESIPPGGLPTPLIPAAATYPSSLPATGLMPNPMLALHQQEGRAHTNNNGPRVAQAPLAATFRPPPTNSSLPPALADVPPSHPPGSNGAEPATASHAPRGALGNAPRRQGPTPRSPARDTSEFLASAFSVGGVGQEVRSQARAQVERARHDPKSVDLANELFGDMSEATTAVTPRDPMLEANHVIGELRSTSPEPKGPSLEEQRLTERIPSIDELVNESSQSVTELTPARRDYAESENSSPMIDSGLTATSTLAVPLSSRPAAEQAPLSLGLGRTPGDTTPRSTPPPRARALWPIVLGVLFVGVAGGVFVLLRPAPTPAPAEPGAPPLVAAEKVPPAQALPEQAQKPAVPVPLPISSTPRGAEVKVDGVASGATPVTLNLVDGTTVELSVRSPGYVVKTEKIAVSSGMPAREIALERLPHVLSITTEPAGATITVGAASTQSPDPLTLGHIDGRSITATIEKPGYLKVTKQIKVDEFREQEGAFRAQLAVTLTAAADSRRRVRALKPLDPSALPVPEAAAEPATATPTPAPTPEPAPPAAEAKPAEKPPEKPPEKAAEPEPDPADKLY